MVCGANQMLNKEPKQEELDTLIDYEILLEYRGKLLMTSARIYDENLG